MRAANALLLVSSLLLATHPSRGSSSSGRPGPHLLHSRLRVHLRTLLQHRRQPRRRLELLGRRLHIHALLRGSAPSAGRTGGDGVHDAGLRHDHD